MKKKTVFNLSAAECSKQGPCFWGWVEGEEPSPLSFTVHQDFYETLLHECDGNFAEADFKAIGYALRVKGYDTTNLTIKSEGETIYE